MLTGRWVLRFSLVLLSSPLLPGRASAQERAPDTALRYPGQIGVELLVPASAGVLDGSGLRATIQRRLGLRYSAHGAGLFLTDRHARVLGGAVGGALAVPWGRVLLEPFVEVGAAHVDARIDSFGYRVAEPDGGTRWVSGYAAARGFVPALGAGMSAAAVLRERYAVRLMAGYWRFRQGDLGMDGVRLGVGVALTRPNDRWLALQTDTLPPSIAVRGASRPDPTARLQVAPAEGVLEILASDESGIAAIRADGRELELWPETAEDRVGEEAGGRAARTVVARYRVNAQPEGTPVRVVVWDSAGLDRASWVVAFPPLDREPPRLLLFQTAGAEAGAAWVGVRAVAADRSGIGFATLDGCPVTTSVAELSATEALGITGPAWLLSGGAPATAAPAVLTAYDPMGNTARATLEPATDADRPAGEATAPQLRVRAVRSVGDPVAGERSVLVDAQAVHPTGIARVTVDGHPAVLYPGGPGDASVRGWLTVPADRPSVRIVVVARDGSEAGRDVEVHPGDRRAGGRLNLLPVVTDPLEATQVRAALGGARDLTAGDAPSGRLLPTLATLRRLGEADAADATLLYVTGSMAAAADGTGGPGLRLTDAPLPFRELAGAARSHPGRLLIVATGLRRGRSWTAPEPPTPGAPPPPGCVDPLAPVTGGILDLGDAAVIRIAEGLAGGADADGDGAVRAGELAAFVTGVPPSGVLPYDPLDPVAGTAGRSR